MSGTTNSTVVLTDTQLLEERIQELQTLHDTWAERVDMPMDVGESGGSTIIHIEELGNMFQRMQDAFVLLVEQTISYMNNRKESIDTKEDAAANQVNE